MSEERTAHGRQEKTSFCIVDAQGVKHTDTAEEKGYDAGKKVACIKRPIVVCRRVCGAPAARRTRHGAMRRILRQAVIGLLCLWLHNASADRGSGIGEGTMHVHFTVSGGLAYLPGLAKPVDIDSDQLSGADAAELQRLVDAANFFSLPSKINPPHPGAADYFQYTVTIEQE